MTRPIYDVRIDWDNDGDFDDFNEDVTDRCLARTPIDIEYGRDQARSLAPIRPGRAVLELDNRSGDYSPENTSSPLAGNLQSGRPVRITATHDTTEYTLYRGFLDDYVMAPDVERRSVSLTALDALARLAEANISTGLHFSIQTGQAIGYVLDAVGWPELDRDLDQGATMIRWWWEEGADALTAVKRIVESEGPPALVTVDPDGRFVFRDRHHRLTRAPSLTTQATFRGTGAEPVMSPPLIYDLGWRDIVNSVTLSVQERHPEGEPSDVWTSSATYTAADGETLLVTAQTSDPFINAITPEAGTDYTLLSGAVTITLSETAGPATILFITASGGPAVLTDLKLRAYSVSTIQTVQIHAEDPVSIAAHGRRSYGQDVPWVGVHDALAVAELIVAHRSERLPVVSIRVGNGPDARTTQQLTRDLSDRVTIIDTESGLDADFFVEQIRHRTDGVDFQTVFGCEKVPDAAPAGTLFRFNTTGAGFDDGVFGASGSVDVDTMFRFDVTGQGFDDAVFAY